MKPVGLVGTSALLGTEEGTLPTCRLPSPPVRVYLSQARPRGGQAARSQRRRPPPPWQRVPWPLAPAHSRPRAVCQPRREGSALFGPRTGRKRLVGPGEEAPNMARGGRGRAGGGQCAQNGGRFRRRAAPPPPRAWPPGPSQAAARAPCGPLLLQPLFGRGWAGMGGLQGAPGGRRGGGSSLA